MTTDDQDEKITLVTLLDGIWPHNPFMVELAKKTTSTLREFIDKTDDFVNAEDMLQTLVDPRKGECNTEGKSNHQKLASNHQAEEPNKEHHQARKGSRYCKYHQTSLHWTEDCTAMKKRVTELVGTRELEWIVAERSKPKLRYETWHNPRQSSNPDRRRQQQDLDDSKRVC